MFEQDTWREASHVYLAAGKRVYSSVIDTRDGLSEWILRFIPAQVMPIELDIDLLSYVLSLLTDQPSSVLYKTLETMMGADKEVERGLIVAWTREWRGEFYNAILLRETSHGLQLRLKTGEDWEEVSYRGDYAIAWKELVWTSS